MSRYEKAYILYKTYFTELQKIRDRKRNPKKNLSAGVTYSRSFDHFFNADQKFGPERKVNRKNNKSPELSFAESIAVVKLTFYIRGEICRKGLYIMAYCIMPK